MSFIDFLPYSYLVRPDIRQKPRQVFFLYRKKRPGNENITEAARAILYITTAICVRVVQYACPVSNAAYRLIGQPFKTYYTTLHDFCKHIFTKNTIILHSVILSFL